MKKPEPIPGLVVRYDYLWTHEAEQGWEDGAKDRPCAVVLSYYRQADGEQCAVLAPITHTGPEEGEVALPIPIKLGRYLGLDSEQSWVKLDEQNVAQWSDPGIVPVEPGKQWEYGRLPKKFWQPAIEIVRGLAKSKKTTMIDRTKEQGK